MSSFLWSNRKTDVENGITGKGPRIEYDIFSKALMAEVIVLISVMDYYQLKKRSQQNTVDSGLVTGVDDKTTYTMDQRKN